jgi:hypothetical protein
LFSSILGKSLGISAVPWMSLTIAIPAVMTTKTTARATDIADVYFNESMTKMFLLVFSTDAIRKYHNAYHFLNIAQTYPIS